MRIALYALWGQEEAQKVAAKISGAHHVPCWQRLDCFSPTDIANSKLDAAVVYTDKGAGAEVLATFKQEDRQVLLMTEEDFGERLDKLLKGAAASKGDEGLASTAGTSDTEPAAGPDLDTMPREELESLARTRGVSFNARIGDDNLRERVRETFEASEEA